MFSKESEPRAGAVLKIHQQISIRFSGELRQQELQASYNIAAHTLECSHTLTHMLI